MSSTNARPTSIRRIIGFHMLGLCVFLLILDWCTPSSKFYPWFPAIPFVCGAGLLIPDLIRVRPLHRILGWICIVILTPLIVLLGLYLADPLVAAAVAIFSLLLGLFFLFPKQKWPLITAWILFAVVYLYTSVYFHSGLMTVWFHFSSYSAVISLFLNIALIFPIVMSVLTYLKWKKEESKV